MTPGASLAGEIGHFAPGVPNLRDFAMPEPGVYVVLYNYFYKTDQLNDRNGDAIGSVTIPPGPGPNATFSIEVDLDLYALTPTLLWISDRRILGATYGAYAFVVTANSSLSAELTNQVGGARSAKTSTFGMGDPFVQPLWLGWRGKHWDAMAAYGFYAPWGKYDTETIALPVVGPVRIESDENTGFGFWTHQLQGAVTWYPYEHRGTAILAASTWEIHGEKEGFDLTPGQNLTINWGVSQFLPLRHDHSVLIEVGPTGYSSWQISDDQGSDARNPSAHDEVHAIGGQLGVTLAAWNAALNLRYVGEISAKDRFEGHSFGVNVAFKL